MSLCWAYPDIQPLHYPTFFNQVGGASLKPSFMDIVSAVGDLGGTTWNSGQNVAGVLPTTLTETNSSPLKINGWTTICVGGGRNVFRGCVSLREGKYCTNSSFKVVLKSYLIKYLWHRNGVASSEGDFLETNLSRLIWFQAGETYIHNFTTSSSFWVIDSTKCIGSDHEPGVALWLGAILDGSEISCTTLGDDWNTSNSGNRLPTSTG